MACIICRNSEEATIFGNLTKCKRCGLVYFDQSSNRVNPQDLYQEGYFTGEEYLDYKHDKSIIQKNFSYRLREIVKFVKSGRLFEIGCAYGFFLELAKKQFSAAGIDITEKPTETARRELQLDAKTGDYLDLRLEDKQDVFCLWDTIERLGKPDEYLAKVNSELNPGGYVFLTTGDIGSALARVQGKKWRMIHPPTHLFYFSKDTITSLLAKNGLKVISITHPGIFRSMKQILYSLLFLGKARHNQWLKSFIDRLDIPVYINTFDIMMLVARKI